MFQRSSTAIVCAFSVLIVCSISGCFAHRNAHLPCDVCPGMPIGDQFVDGGYVVPHAGQAHAHPTPMPAPAPVPESAPMPDSVPVPAPAPQNSAQPPLNAPPAPAPKSTPAKEAAFRPTVTGPAIPSASGYANLPNIDAGQVYMEPQMPQPSLLRRLGHSVGRALSRLKPTRSEAVGFDTWESVPPQPFWNNHSDGFISATPSPTVTDGSNVSGQAYPQLLRTPAADPYSGYRNQPQQTVPMHAGPQTANSSLGRTSNAQ